MFRKPLKTRWQSTVYSFRRLGFIHKPAKWLKDYLWAGLVEGAIEFSRRVFASSRRFGPPTRVVSIYQNLRTGDPPTIGRIVLHDQGCPKVKPDSLLALGGYQQHKEQPWPIFWSYHSNARLVTQSLALMLDRKTLCLESAHGHGHVRTDPAFRFLTLPAPVRLEGKWTSIVSRWSPCGKPGRVSNVNHSHWVLDALPRLALINEFPAETKIVVPANLYPQHKESLALMELLDRCRFTSEHHLAIDEYYFSPPTAVLDCYNPYAVEFLRRVFLPKRDQGFSGPKRFLIRRGKDMRTGLNEEELERFILRIGWDVVDVSKLSFAQQVQLFHEADIVVGMSGSALTNTVFCRPQCRVIGFMFDWALDGWLDWISQVVGFDWRAIIVRTDYTRQYRIDVGKLESLIQL